jgi:hypothetical protein
MKKILLILPIEINIFYFIWFHFYFNLMEISRFGLNAWICENQIIILNKRLILIIFKYVLCCLKDLMISVSYSFIVFTFSGSYCIFITIAGLDSGFLR